MSGLPSQYAHKGPESTPYRYADLSVACGKPVFEKAGGVDVLTNPTLIIDVLSDSTEAYDRGDKFTHYKSIKSLLGYLLIAQHRPHVTHYEKNPDGSWDYAEINEISGSVHLASIDCTLELTELYREVTFPDKASPSVREPGDTVQQQSPSE